MFAAVHTTGINLESWAAIAGPILASIGTIARYARKRGEEVGNKLDALGRHLERQDAAKRRLDQRLVRLEEHAGLDPMPLPENGRS